MANDEQVIELLHSQAHIWNHIFNFINSMSLKSAIQLNIPDIIHKHGQPMTLSVLVNALPINQSKAPCICRLMRILVQSGFFIKQKISQEGVEEEEGYLAIPSKEKGGKVIIIDMTVGSQKEDDESMETQLFFDMLMMILVTGRERNEKDWAKLFSDAGFSDYKITPTLGLRSLIEVYP